MKTYYFTQEFRGDYWGQNTYYVEADSEEEALELIKQDRGKLYDSWSDSGINDYDDIEFDYAEED